MRKNTKEFVTAVVEENGRTAEKEKKGKWKKLKNNNNKRMGG